ncbi:MAG: CpXC domain-containing protein [Erysipelotrichaceae bacterium]|nr:CpXC domain-containing protein [Erysipelotrichaceae bacterium]
MSLEKITSIVCNQCQKNFDITVWDSINVSLDPSLKEKILNNNLFVFECPHCGKQFYLSYDFLYHDMDAEYMIQYTCKENDKKVKEELLKSIEQLNDLKIQQNIQTIGNGYRYRLVNTFHRLIDKINIIDRNYDDRIMEIYKYILLMQVYDKDPDNLVDILFDKVAKDTSPVFILMEKDLPEHFRTIGFNEEVYQGLEKQYGHQLNVVSEQLIVDLEWAKTFFESITS